MIEDAAHALGSRYKGKTIGSFSDIASFSFYANKIITTGEGGIVITDDLKLAERARWFGNFCFDTERRYIHQDIGFKYPMTNIQAAIGVAQLEHIEEIIKLKIKYLKQSNKI